MPVKFPMVYKRDDESPWVTYAKQQVYRKNNCINLVVTGEPGSSKSWSLMSYLSACDPSFNIDRVFFKGAPFMRFLNSKGLTRGKAVMFDEAGVEMYSLNWQNEINRGLNALFQTMRHKNYIFGMTVPYMGFLSKGVRTLMNTRFQTMGWSTKTGKSKVIPRRLEYNQEKDKIYKKRLIVKSKKGMSYCDFIELPAPPKELIKDYEQMKKEFTEVLYSDIQESLENFETKKKLTIFKERPDYLPPRSKLYIDGYREGLSTQEIAEKYSIDPRVVRKMRQIVEAKGYYIFKPQNNGRYEVITAVEGQNA